MVCAVSALVSFKATSTYPWAGFSKSLPEAMQAGEIRKLFMAPFDAVCANMITGDIHDHEFFSLLHKHILSLGMPTIKKG